MQPNKIDSVYGYLTPKKFLSSLMNPAQKNKQTRTEIDNQNSPQHSHSNLTSSPRKRRESYKKNNTSNPMNTSEAKFNEQNENKSLRKSEHENRNNVYDQKIDVRHVEDSRLHDTDIMMLNTGNNNGLSGTQDINLKFSNDGDSRVNLKNSHVYAKTEIGNNNNFGPVEPLNKKTNIPVKKNVEVTKLVVQELMGKLVHIKNELEREITELKSILDETADGLELMDKEFEKVKEKILVYTSRSLDSAFREYKRNLPNWTIFESVENTGLKRIAEMSQTISLLSDESTLKSIGGRDEVERMIEIYAGQLDETRDAKMECYSQRPIISEDKVRRLEGILREIGHF